MTFTIQQMVIAGMVLVGSTVLAVLRIINPDAVIALYSAVLGAVLNSTVARAQVPVEPGSVVRVADPEDGHMDAAWAGWAVLLLVVLIFLKVFGVI